MDSFEFLFRKKKSSKTYSVRILLNYLIAGLIPLFVIFLHFLFPQVIDFSTVILVALLGVGFSSWTGGYKTGLVTTLFFAIVVNIPSLTPQTSTPTIFLIGSAIRTVLLLLGGALLSMLIDVGRRQETIAKYKEREKEIKAHLASLILENERLSKEVRLRDEFLSIASHELKTPLTSMLLQTQTALHNIRNVSLAQFSIENLLKMLESLEHQTKRLSKIISELFNISIMTSGNLALERENCDLETIVQQVLNDFEARFIKEGYTVIFQKKESVKGFWDKVRIEQAVSNLVSNAIKYGAKKPIEVRVKKHGNYGEILIEDHGIGISKKKQKEIFGLFERGVSPEDYKGLGVGLYITEQIVKAHNGLISVDSELSEGTKFIIKLPLKSEGT